ncbi:MAG: Zn-dependent hydrolase [Bacteroidales bacterium]|nr:Zn-dependent hydrolase [Bacteroidales bacterium]
MKKLMISMIVLSMLGATGCKSKKDKDENVQLTEIEQKVAEYAPFTLTTNLNVLSDSEKQLIPIFIQIADIMDDLFWEQAFGSENRAALDTISDPAMKEFAMIQYGAWDRLDGEKPFLPGFGEKPKGANFYPTDMTDEEFAKLGAAERQNQYSIIRRDSEGKLQAIPYHEAYAEKLAVVDSLLGEAIAIADNPGMKRYLETRREAFQKDYYFTSDMAWMDMKDSRLDFVVGPIENYEDGLYGLKTAYEAFILVKDEKWSNDISRFVHLLPELQKQLPCDPKYKKEVPGTESDLNVYDVVYYAGDCNSGSKTIAINLPNDENVQLIKGARRLQLKNAMNAKFEMILKPIAGMFICDEQQDNVKFDAFFSNVCFHEVAHGLGIKNTVNGKGNVRTALGNQYSTWEEAKADICGLFITQKLIEQGQIKGLTAEDAYVTFLAGILRSVRFGATEAHGIANMMCFNYLQDNNAFTRNQDGKYVIDVKNFKAAMESWAAMIIAIEGEGDIETATSYAKVNGLVRPDLQRDLDAIRAANIPRDIRYNQGLEALGLTK